MIHVVGAALAGLAGYMGYQWYQTNQKLAKVSKVPVPPGAKPVPPSAAEQAADLLKQQGGLLTGVNPDLQGNTGTGIQGPVISNPPPDAIQAAIDAIKDQTADQTVLDDTSPEALAATLLLSKR